MIILWQQSRKRFKGTNFLVVDFIFQLLCILLIFLRGHIPDFFSIDISNTLAVAGAVFGFIGLEYFTGKKSSQLHNYLLIVVFFSIHTYFTFVKPSLDIRNLNTAVATLIICIQCAWLLLKRVPVTLRKFTLDVGIVFALFSAVNILRIVEFFVHGHTATDYFNASGFETFVIISYQLLFVLFTFTLAIMINKRLLADIASQEEKFSTAFHSVPYAIIITRLSDGRLFEVNDGFEKMTGFSTSEVIGKTTRGLKLWANETDREILVNTISEKGKVKELEVVLCKKTGEHFAGLISSEVIAINSETCILSVIVDITERSRSDKALKKSEAKFRQLFVNMEEGFALHEVIYDDSHHAIDYKIIDINPAFEKQVGITVEKASGALATQLYGVSPAPYLDVYAKVAETGEPYSFQTYFPPLDKHFEISIFSPNSGLFATIFTDITERKKAENELREKEVQYRNLADSGMALIWRSGTDKLCNYFNEPWLKFTGRTLQQEMGNGWAEGVHPDDFDRCLATYVNAFEKRESFNMEYRLLHADGDYRWLMDKGTPNYNVDGEFVGYIGHCFDITELKQVDGEIKLKNEELQKLNAEKDKFFSIIAHDLKSPFNSFLGYTELMVDELDNMSLKQIQTIAVDMKRSANYLYGLLENLLQWSRIQRGISGFDPTTFFLKPKIEDSIYAVMELATKKGITIKATIPEELEVVADSNMLESIIRNLTTNAVKFTSKGGEVKINANPVDYNQVKIAVTDTGIGMDKKLMDKLFRLDEQTNRKGTEGEASTGLGLIICKDFVEKHGGKIWVESKEGEGSTFYFTVPKKHT
jgi:PAS domain S-box-containing protein